MAQGRGWPKAGHLPLHILSHKKKKKLVNIHSYVKKF